MTNGAPNGGFRESFRGYNKDDVNSYITAAARSRSESDAAFKRTISEQKERIKSLEAALDTQKKEYDKKNAQIPDDLPQRAARLEVEALQREAVIAAQNESLSQKDEEIEMLRAKLAESDDNIRVSSGEEYDKLAEKAELYDKMSERMGSLLIRANEQADGIVADAGNRAGDIIAEAQNRANELEAEAINNSRESCRAVISNAANKLFAMANDVCGQANNDESVKSDSSEADKSGEILTGGEAADSAE
ncbi:MAG: hypothetical protein WCQ72_02415 [Eubacteriales bacterium]